MTEEYIESSAIYLISDARMELVDLYVGDATKPYNYMEMALEYSYVDNEGETMTCPLPPLCMDLDMLIEMSALISRAMVRLEDANPIDIVGWAENDIEPGAHGQDDD
jgi:hypothetical protein